MPRMIALAALAVGLAPIQAQAAAASPAPASAVVLPPEVQAGTPNLNFSVNVYNPLESQGGVGDIDAVRVVIPSVSVGKLLVAPEQASAVGWAASIEGGIVTYTGGSLQNGYAAAFRVEGDVARPASDSSGIWQVEVSRDGGATFEPAVPTTSGLETKVRVLEVSSVALVSPEEVTDGSVTSGQQGVCARVEIRNQGSASLSVSVGLEGDQLVAGAARAGHGNPCGGAVLAGGLPVGAGASGTVDFPMEIGEARVTSLTASASSGASVSHPRSAPVVIQGKPQPAFVSGSMQPRFTQTRAPISFRLSVSKGAGTPSLEFTYAALSMAGCPDLTLNEPAEMGVGASSVQLRFRPCTPTGSDGRYTPNVSLSFLDDNGAPGTVSFAVADTVVFDNSVPAIEATMTPTPASQIPGTAGAFKNGDDVTIQGVVKDRDADSGQQAPCEGCSITVQVQQYDSSCSTPFGGPSQLLSKTGSGFSTTYRVAMSGGLAFRMILRATDQAGNSVSQVTHCVEVDNNPPLILGAKTTSVAGESRRGVIVTLSECVQGTSIPLDWRIGSLPPTAVGAVTCSPDGRASLVLTSATQLPATDPAGTLGYEPLPAPVGGKYTDRVGHAAPPATVSIRQGAGQ